MISHGKDIKVFCGNANQPLAAEICQMMGTKLGESEVKSFADGEVSVSLYETVRGSDVFVVQSTCKPVNDNLMELLVMIDALRRASAGRITAVIPYFGYARQDRKAKARDPISAKLVANMITAAGADRVLTMDLHASQIQGFFDIPVDNLLGNPIFVDYYAKKFGDKCEDMIVVSPDVGSVARARAFAQKLHMQMAIVDKRRQKANQCEVMNVIGDVKGKDCILFDDMVDTAGSLCNAAKAIVEVGGARKVYACASHGVDSFTHSPACMVLMYWPFIQSSLVSSNTASFFVMRSRPNFSHSTSRGIIVVSPSRLHPRRARKFTIVSGK